MFADEKRLREEITQVYMAICLNEAGPSNLQLESIRSLTAQVDAAAIKASQLNMQFEEKLKQILQKSKK
jgi:hypothetical protein